jgi:hypothetical protein
MNREKSSARPFYILKCNDEKSPSVKTSKEADRFLKSAIDSNDEVLLLENISIPTGISLILFLICKLLSITIRH